MIFGFRLKELRKNRKLSQGQLARLLGVSKVSISGYEIGTQFPSIKIIIKILDLFNVSADYLLGREINVICEDINQYNAVISRKDIAILKYLKNNPKIYYKVLEDPERFFVKVQSRDFH